MAVESNAGRVGVWGRSGSGKSTYVKGLIAARSRVVVFDPLDEYGKLRGFVTLRSVEALRIEMAKRWRGGFKLAYVPPSMQEAAALDRLSLLCLRAQVPFRDGKDRRQLTLVVEEMNLCFPVNGLPGELRGFGEICSRGRHYGIEVVGVSQRIAEVATRFRGNCTATVVFAQQGPRDLRAAADALGFADPVEVRGLGDHEYLRAENGTIERGKNRLRA
ncbi:MAG: helicase HerA domain-containing protein [Kiloniellaceae bacterium]